jgi:hypothetical protein
MKIQIFLNKIIKIFETLILKKNIKNKIEKKKKNHLFFHREIFFKFNKFSYIFCHNFRKLSNFKFILNNFVILGRQKLSNNIECQLNFYNRITKIYYRSDNQNNNCGFIINIQKNFLYFFLLKKNRIVKNIIKEDFWKLIDLFFYRKINYQLSNLI